MTKEEFNNLEIGDIIYRNSEDLEDDIQGKLKVVYKNGQHIGIETIFDRRYSAHYEHFRTTKKKLKKDDDIVTLKIIKTITGLTRVEAKKVAIDIGFTVPQFDSSKDFKIQTKCKIKEKINN
jgi:hypothetical protein